MRAVARAEAVWGLLLCSSVIYFFSDNAADNDLWGHLLFGRDMLTAGFVPQVDTYSYTAAGQPWVNHEWLAQVVLAAVYGWAGAPGLLALKLVIGAATFLCMFGLIRQRAATPAVRGVVGLLSIAVLARGLAIRPQIFTYLGVAVLLLIVDSSSIVNARRRSAVYWCLPVLFAIWANLHGGFVLGLGILGLFALAEMSRAPRQAWRMSVVFFVAVAATMLNPFGPRLFAFVWNELSRAHPITEWQPAVVTDIAQFAFFGMFGLFIVALACSDRSHTRWWEVLLALATGVIAIRHQRHTPVFAVCAAAPLALQLEDVSKRLARVPALMLGLTAQRIIAAGVLALVVLQLGLTVQRYRRDGAHIVFDPAEYPTAAVQAMRDTGVAANVAVPLDWGEYVLWFLAPAVKVSLDGRFATVFPETVVQQNFDLFSGAPEWRRLLTNYATDAVLVPAGAPSPMATLPDWQIVFRSQQALLYARHDTPVCRAFQHVHEPRVSREGIFP